MFSSVSLCHKHVRSFHRTSYPTHADTVMSSVRRTDLGVSRPLIVSPPGGSRRSRHVPLRPVLTTPAKQYRGGKRWASQRLSDQVACPGQATRIVRSGMCCIARLSFPLVSLCSFGVCVGGLTLYHLQRLPTHLRIHSSSGGVPHSRCVHPSLLALTFVSCLRNDAG